MTQYVYLVEDTENCPGRILAVFASEDDAIRFAKGYPDLCDVINRQLWYGQVNAPPTPGHRF